MESLFPRIGIRRGLRLLAAGCLLLQLGASIFARHRHLNPIGDLFGDGPSDSGTFLRAEAPASGRFAAMSGFDFVDDDPCLACFAQDYRSFTAIRFRFIPAISIRPLGEAHPRVRVAFFFRLAPIIRGPPRFLC